MWIEQGLKSKTLVDHQQSMKYKSTTIKLHGHGAQQLLPGTDK
jgi:hypothetical protein